MTAEDRQILADWSRLGIAWNVRPAQRLPDVERLIVRSLSMIPTNARLLVLMASWLTVYWRCVGRDRLMASAANAPAPEQATLGIILQTVDGWLGIPVFVASLRRLHPAYSPEPLLEADRESAAMARLAAIEASDVSRRWGLWCLPIDRKLDAIRPPTWVFKVNRMLRTRCLFKVR